MIIVGRGKKIFPLGRVCTHTTMPPKPAADHAAWLCAMAGRVRRFGGIVSMCCPPALGRKVRVLLAGRGAEQAYAAQQVYTRDFDVKGYNKRATYRLDLGGVGCMAEVYLNGQMLGTLWKAPYAIDITPALKKKGNKLEVRVTNLWAGVSCTPPK